MRKVLIVDTVAGDWRRVYVDGVLLIEQHPARIDLELLLRGLGHVVVSEVVDRFNFDDD
jgi:hypothetical protein